jgi:hypothetical protein
LAILEQKIKGYKQSFGVVLFEEFVKAEDSRGYLPSDRQVRSIYDTCRGDIQKLEDNKRQKVLELHSWGGDGGTGAEDGATMPSVVEHSQGGFGSNGGNTSTNEDLNMQSSYLAPSMTTSSSGARPATDTEDLLL